MKMQSKKTASPPGTKAVLPLPTGIASQKAKVRPTRPYDSSTGWGIISAVEARARRRSGSSSIRPTRTPMRFASSSAKINASVMSRAPEGEASISRTASATSGMGDLNSSSCGDASHSSEHHIEVVQSAHLRSDDPRRLQATTPGALHVLPFQP